MSTLKRSAITLCLAYALAACSSSDSKPQKDSGSEDEADAAVEEEADAEADDEADAGTPSAPVPLTVWVDDLVDNHTTNESEPDTVDDKVISDDTDETSFDKYLP